MSVSNSSYHNRRQFLKFITGKSLSTGLAFLSCSELITACTKNHKLISKKMETPPLGIQPTFEDQLVLAPGLDYHIICQWNSPINQRGDLFGSNNDFICFLPMKSINEGLLWVNHESIIPELVHPQGRARPSSPSREEIQREQKLVGGSIIMIKKNEKGQWIHGKSSKYNRRLDGKTAIGFSHNYKIQGSKKAIGTLANCGGGLTPWRTFLTCEENFDDFYGDSFWENGQRRLETKAKFQWNKHFHFPPEHYGWVVEVDPLTGRGEKQVLLGRFCHEGATPVLTKKGNTVVYMGEDKMGGFIYKFVSTGRHLKKGTLYAADTIKGQWLPLDIKKNQTLQKMFKSQKQVLIYAHQSAEAVGATPQDRPEDIEVHGKTGDIFISLTKNPKTSNKYGSLLKITEEQDHDSLRFKTSVWISGGIQSGLACPDNLCFDSRGNLWVTLDIKEVDIGHPDYKNFGNNGLFYIPFKGTGAGKAIQVASAPKNAELTGPWFSPDEKTLFLSVQHPGSLSTASHYTSHWPNGPGQKPRSAVVALQGEFLTSK